MRTQNLLSGPQRPDEQRPQAHLASLQRREHPSNSRPSFPKEAGVRVCLYLRLPRAHPRAAPDPKAWDLGVWIQAQIEVQLPFLLLQPADPVRAP